MSAQTRCCVVCSRSSPKTIFSCRYKVHQRNVEVLRTFFKRELDFGELCDRCYRLWYKHKRAKKEPTNNTTQNAKNTRKRKSITDIAIPTSPSGIEPPRYTTNGYMTRIESSGSGPLQYPPFKKYKNNDEVEYNGLHMSSVQMEQMSGHSFYEHDEECYVEEEPTIAMNNDNDDNQDEQKLVQTRLQEQQDEEILEEISNTSQEEQHEERELSLLDAIKVITQAPRISKRKPVPLKSPLKLDPVYEHVVCTNYAQMLFLSKQNQVEKDCVNNESIEETVTA